MSIPPGYTPGVPHYYQVEVLADNTVMYRQLSFVRNVEPESRKWHPRADRFSIICLGICVIDSNIHSSSTLHRTLLLLEALMICSQLYCIAKMVLAFCREFRDSKGSGYDIFVGPAYTVPLPPANCGLGSNNSVDAHISGQTEKVSFSE